MGSVWVCSVRVSSVSEHRCCCRDWLFMHVGLSFNILMDICFSSNLLSLYRLFVNICFSSNIFMYIGLSSYILMDIRKSSRDVF